MDHVTELHLAGSLDAQGASASSVAWTETHTPAAAPFVSAPASTSLSDAALVADLDGANANGALEPMALWKPRYLMAVI